METWYFSPLPKEYWKDDVTETVRRGTQRCLERFRHCSARARRSTFASFVLSSSSTSLSVSEAWACLLVHATPVAQYRPRPLSVLHHMTRCTWKSPPGDEIYRGADGVCMWEVDGAKDVEYCQNVSYLAKMVRLGSPSPLHTSPALLHLRSRRSFSITRRSCTARASFSSTSSRSSTSTATT